MVKGGVKRFTVSTPARLLEEFDSVVGEMGYDRSKAVAVAMRNFLAEYAWDRRTDKEGAGALTLIYDHEKSNVDKELTEIQHQLRHIIVSATHIHLDEQNCLLTIAVRGKVASIQNLARKIMATPGVKQLRLATLCV